MSIEHTIECRRMAAKIERQYAEWSKDWPHYCKTCGGWGGKEEQMFLTVGDEERIFMECPDCLGKDNPICPRCGESIDESMIEEYNLKIPCAECGWSWGSNEDDTEPVQYQCYGECIEEEPKRKVIREER